MDIRIEDIGADRLREYAGIPIAFEVRSILQIEPLDCGLGGIRLNEIRVEPAYVKDYDAYDEGRPERWTNRFILDNWGIFIAHDGSRPVGGGAVVSGGPDVQILGGREGIAVLWDLRVHPEFRRSGIGTMLLDYATSWSREQGCKRLRMETQNVNVPACRFYAKQGCRLGEIDLYAYAAHPRYAHEVMLVWYLDL